MIFSGRIFLYIPGDWGKYKCIYAFFMYVSVCGCRGVRVCAAVNEICAIAN